MKKILLFSTVGITFILGIYFLRANPSPSVLPASTSNVFPTLSHRIKTSGCVAQGPLPDKRCTPGATLSNITADNVCVSGYSRSVRKVASSLKYMVFSEYGITEREPGEYEVDHFIPLELGGSNDISNLWPEPADPQPGFHQKDRVENFLHKEVCNGTISLEEAQLRIADNWVSVFEELK